METTTSIIELVTPTNFSEEGYLLYNPDIADAVKSGSFTSGRHHYNLHGSKESRSQYVKGISNLRLSKLEKIEKLIDFSLQHTRTKEHQLNFLTNDLKKEFNITDTSNISAHGYDQNVQKIIKTYKDGIILDCGSGLRNNYYNNVINYEIVNYYSTDIIGVGEKLPFKDNSFDAVISIAVLEHVKDPFICAKEITRVLKKGGVLYSAIPFLQPYHGYPHHYYNMTYQGHLNLYEQHFEDIKIEVIDPLKPIFTLTWFLNSYINGLPEKEKTVFKNKKISDLLNSPESYLADDFVKKLSESANLELASGTLLRGTKK